jgi:hypothetical protein
MSEAEQQRAILDYLQLKGHFCWRNNSGAYKTDHGSFIRFGTLGSPDIFVLRAGCLFGIEVKSATGGVHSKNQERRTRSSRHEASRFQVRRQMLCA